VWIFGWDEAWMSVDLVIDQAPPSPFLSRVLDYLAWGIANNVMLVERGTTATRYVTAMDPAWVRANWQEIVKLETTFHDAITRTPVDFRALPSDTPGKCVIELAATERLDPNVAAFLERCVVRLLGYWHRVSYTEDAKVRETMPPGDLRIRDQHVEILAGGRPMDWTPRDVPALFAKAKRARKR
jgi:hypothetical protein